MQRKHRDRTKVGGPGTARGAGHPRTIWLLELAGEAGRRHDVAGAPEPGAVALAMGDYRCRSIRMYSLKPSPSLPRLPPSFACCSARDYRVHQNGAKVRSSIGKTANGSDPSIDTPQSAARARRVSCPN